MADAPRMNPRPIHAPIVLAGISAEYGYSSWSDSQASDPSAMPSPIPVPKPKAARLANGRARGWTARCGS